MYSSSVAVVVVALCRALVHLEFRVIVWLGAGRYVSGGRLFLFGSLSFVSVWVGYGRLRLWVRAIWVFFSGLYSYASCVVVFEVWG